MSKQQLDKTESIASLVIVGMIVLYFTAPILIAIIKFLLVVGFLAGLGYLSYRLLTDKEWQAKLEDWFGDFSDDDIISISPHEAEIFGLPEPQNNQLLDELSSLKQQMATLEKGNRKLKKKRKKKIKKALRLSKEQIAQQNKQALLKDLFGASPANYAESDEFERREFEEQKKKATERLDMREFQQGVKEQLFEQEKEIIEVRYEAKEDRTHIRMEMKDGFLRVDQMLMQLESRIITLKGYFDEKFSQMQVAFMREITTVKENIMGLRVEVERGFSNVKGELAQMTVSFNKEIVRIDKAQMQTVQKLGEYENKVRQFVLETGKMRNEVERFSIRGQRVLEQAQIVYQKHRADIQVMGSQLQAGLGQIAIHKQDFALRAGQAKLQLDKISQEQYLQLKNIGFAEMGVKMLRQDYSQREALQTQKMQNIVAEKRRVEERIREAHSRGEQTAQMNHQIRMLDERHRNAQQQNAIMRQEARVFKKLSR